jgi:hypothetical protein
MSGESAIHEPVLDLGADEVDPELVALPAPPRRERHLTVGLLLLTAVLSAAMVVGLRRDAVYAFSRPVITDLGDLSAAPATAFVENTYIEGRGLVGAAGAIRYERPFASETFRAFPVLHPSGQPNVWVEVRLPPGAEGARYVPPSSFTGRLVRFDEVGPRHRGLRSAIASRGQPVPPGAWLLVDGEAPGEARWAVVLTALFTCFAVWNLYAVARLLRRVR